MSGCFRAFLIRDVRLTLAYPFNFAMQWITVAITVFSMWFVAKLVPNSHLFGLHAGASYFEYVVVNLAFFSVMQTSMQSLDNTVRGDQVLGTLESIVTSLRNGLTYAFASMTWPLIMTSLQVVWYFALGTLLFGLNIGNANVPATLLSLLLIVCSTLPLGIMSAAATLRYKQIGPANLMVGGAVSLLSGVLFPISLLPPVLRVVSWLLPITHGLRAVRAALSGAPTTALTPDIVWLLVATAALLPLSLVAFNAALERERRNGTLVHY